jgi:hypothetical protein
MPSAINSIASLRRNASTISPMPGMFHSFGIRSRCGIDYSFAKLRGHPLRSRTLAVFIDQHTVCWRPISPAASERSFATCQGKGTSFARRPPHAASVSAFGVVMLATIHHNPCAPGRPHPFTESSNGPIGPDHYLQGTAKPQGVGAIILARFTLADRSCKQRQDFAEFTKLFFVFGPTSSPLVQEPSHSLRRDSTTSSLVWPLRAAPEILGLLDAAMPVLAPAENVP